LIERGRDDYLCKVIGSSRRARRRAACRLRTTMAMSGSTAILLFDYMAKKKRVSFSPVFQPLLGPLEAAAETILLERLDVSQAGFEEAPLSARRVGNKPSARSRVTGAQTWRPANEARVVRGEGGVGQLREVHEASFSRRDGRRS
jgi:hypothetical protein